LASNRAGRQAAVQRGGGGDHEQRGEADRQGERRYQATPS